MIRDVLQLPIPNINKSGNDKIVKLVDAIMEAYKLKQSAIVLDYHNINQRIFIYR